MTTAADLCARGFLPRELPPPFQSTRFGAFVATGWRPQQRVPTRVAAHSLFRSGSLRRLLSIPNPVTFTLLAQEVEQRWAQLQPIYSLSPWTLTRPTVGAGRAVDAQRSPRVLLLARAASRAGNRYAVRADISRFYYSLYTHTIEWAAHTKQVVKQNRALPRNQQQRLWGRRLDDLHRSLQDGQSISIPVGPDTSLIAAELVLARVDEVVAQSVTARGVRYIDDYELCFPTLSAAEHGLARLQEALAEYELALNPHKTEIYELPAPLEPSWVRTLRRIRVRSSGNGQRFDFVDLFDAAFDLLERNRDAHILNFVMGIVGHAACLPTNWPMLESLILQAVVVEPGIIREALHELLRQRSAGRPINVNRIAEALSNVVVRHAPLGHGSEVAWALWSHIALGLPIDQTVLNAAERMDDPVVALVTLDAWHRTLLPRPPNSHVWNNMMTVQGLMDSGWLLAYEAATKGWFSAAHLAGDPDFSAMHAANVEFYEFFQNPAAAPLNLSGPGADGRGGSGGGAGGGGGWS